MPFLNSEFPLEPSIKQGTNALCECDLVTIFGLSHDAKSKSHTIISETATLHDVFCKVAEFFGVFF
jgi:hypothetical protein